MNTKKTACLNGEITVGDIVLSTPDSNLRCLIGVVTEIMLHDPDLPNTIDDIYVDFTGELSETRLAELERYLTDLYKTPKTIHDVEISRNIMYADWLIKITDLPTDKLEWIKQSEGNASAYAFEVLYELFRKLRGHY